MASCKLCHKEGRLCLSHIVPEFVYAPLYDSGRKMIGFLEDREGIRSHLIQKGLRETLLCSICERHINRNFEQPNLELWRKLAAYDESANTEWKLFTTPEGSKVVLVSGVDYRSFKLMLLSILWRASVSTRHEYSEVSLGRHEKPIRRMILEGDAGPRYCYPCILFKFDEPGVILRPIRRRINGHRVYHFILTTIHVWYFVSGHIADEPIIDLALREDGVFSAIRLDPRETQLYTELRRLERETKHSRSVVRRINAK
ncbi:MAG: hypothetical protein HY695_21390 [Deltaproteobacteria bacterium]|nr:hypothetical protein [Deltaproteobacteria bacterium]